MRVYPRGPFIGRGKKTILIVEDNGLLLGMLSKCFEMSGWRVLRANNGLDGWNLAKCEPIDLVLTDIQMPGLDGIELSHKIRDNSPEIIIALMTGGDEQAANDLMEKGTVDYFFKKPFPLNHVCDSLTAKTGDDKINQLKYFE